MATFEIATDFTQETTRDKIRWFFQTPTWTTIAQICVLAILALSGWAIAYSIFRDAVGPQSQFISLVTLFISAKIFGCIVSVFKIPPLLGQLIMGVLLRSVGFIELSGPYIKFAAILRQLALVNIMLPAGLGLDPTALRKMSLMVMNLSLVPPICEVLTMLVVAKFIMDVPWIWSLLMGLLMAAVSPSVTIPCLFELQALGYGVNKGIHTLVIAASTVNDIVSIAAFGLLIGIMFSSDNLTMKILQGPIGVIIGMAFGITWGLMARYIPDKKDKYLVTLRTLLIAFGSILSAIGSEAINYGSAGALGCIVAAFVACQGWRKEGYGTNNNPVKANFDLIWKFFEPISFGLIGYEINLSVLKGDTVLWGSISLLIALAVRIAVTLLITIRNGFNLKEKVFIGLSWLPKATVQAALGPVALDYVRNGSNREDIDLATKALIVSVMSIILTAPIGALLIMQLGPKLLHRTIPNEPQNNPENE